MSNIYKTIILFFVLLPLSTFAKLNIMTTTPNLKYLTQKIGGNKVQVMSICKGTQDPHFIQAKPSFMIKASRADLIIAVGLDLEIGWLPLILKGSRNLEIQPGQKGYLEASSFISPLEKPTGKISRADGDVHPFGNPHFMLDPVRVLKVVKGISDKLVELDPSNGSFYKKNAKLFIHNLTNKIENWTKRLNKTHKKVVTYHKTLTYFYNRFNVTNVDTIELKPGVPPTANHIIRLINEIKSKKVHLVLIENFYDDAAGRRIKKEVPSISIQTIPVEVKGAAWANSLEDIYEKYVSLFEMSK